MENRMTDYQKVACEQLKQLLDNEIARKNYNKNGIKDIFVVLIRHYAEITEDYKKAYQNPDLYKKHHRISKRASDIINGESGKKGGLTKKEINKQLHPEHIVPVSEIIRQLIGLGPNPSIEAIKRVLDNYEMIIITKEEAHILDGSKDKEYPIDNGTHKVAGKGMKSKGSASERLDALNEIPDFEFDPKYEQNNLFN